MQDGFPGCETSHLCPRSPGGADSDHLSLHPLSFLQFVTNYSSGQSPLTSPFTISGIHFLCWALSTSSLRFSPSLSRFSFIPGHGGREPVLLLGCQICIRP